MIDWIVVNIGLVAVVIAIVVGIINAFSLKYTRDALALTRNTQRPFLSNVGYHPISISPNLDIVPIKIEIKNSGALPAFNMNIRLDFFAEDEEVELFEFSKKYKVRLGEENDSSTLFPNVTQIWEDYLHKNNDVEKPLIEDMLASHKIKIRTTISYESNAFGNSIKHKTISTAEWRTTETNQKGLFDIPPAYSI